MTYLMENIRISSGKMYCRYELKSHNNPKSGKGSN